MWTNEDGLMLAVMVETWVDRAVRFEPGQISNSKNQARKKVREAKAKVNEARQERERHNVDDAASFVVELGRRLAAVDEWEQGRVAEIRAEAERRGHGHRRAGAAAVSRMLERGETPTAIAELAGVKVSEVRAVLKSAGAQTGAVLGDSTDPTGVGGTASREGVRGEGAAARPRSKGSSYALSMKISGVAHQLHLSRLMELVITGVINNRDAMKISE